jgi:hypothetical protein
MNNVIKITLHSIKKISMVYQIVKDFLETNTYDRTN